MDRHLEPYAPLDSDREQVVRFWADLVIRANSLASGSALLMSQRSYVADRATWAVTEITPAAGTKIFRQRYWSLAALEWAAQPLVARSDAGKALRHEHVVERRTLKQQLEVCTSVEQAIAVLETAVACVVTKDEGKKLDRSEEIGWARYESLSIQVFDRQLRTTMDHEVIVR